MNLSCRKSWFVQDFRTGIIPNKFPLYKVYVTGVNCLGAPISRGLKKHQNNLLKWIHPPFSSEGGLLFYFCCWRVGDEKIKKDGVIIRRVNRVGDNMKSDWKSRSHGLLFDQKYFTGFFVAHGRMIARVVVSTFSQVARIIIIYILFILYIWSYMYIQFFGSVQCTSMYIQFFGSVQSVWLDFRQNWSSDTGVMRWSEVWCWDERLCVGWFNDRTFDRNNICWDGFEMLKKLGACVQSSMALGWPQTLLGYPGFFVRGHKSYRLINFYCKLAFWGRILCLILMLF